MTEDDWTEWGDRHPWIAGLVMVGIYALCWAGVLASLGIAAFLFAWVSSR